MSYFRLGSYMRLLLLQEKFSTFKNKKILDVGCNYGEITKALARDNQVVGVDTDEEALKIAKKTIKKGKFIKASAVDLPFPDRIFDVVTCLAVIEHIHDDQKAIHEMSRVLKKRGELILATPNQRAQLVPNWLTPILKLINKIFKTKFPVSEKEYLHFGQEGIGHVRQGYSSKKINDMLAEEKIKLISYKTYWHSPTRLGYLLLMPLIKGGYLKEKLAKAIFLPFFFLDKIFKDKKGDVLIFAQKI